LSAGRGRCQFTPAQIRATTELAFPRRLWSVSLAAVLFSGVLQTDRLIGHEPKRTTRGQ